jgi:hypothetical protein
VRPGIDRRIEACGVLTGAVQLGSVVQTRSVRVERQVGQAREQQRTGSAEVVFYRRGELATEEDGAARINHSQHVGSFGEIDRLDEPSVQAAGIANVGVEIGEALDVDQTSGHDPPFFQKNLPH